MRSAAVGDKLERLVKVLGRCLGILHVIAHVAAVDQGFRQVRLNLQAAGIVVNRLLQELVLLVYVAGQQREVGLFGQNTLVAAHQRENIIVASKIVIVVSQIHGCVAIMR